MSRPFYYYMVVTGGVEIERSVLFLTFKERDEAAKKTWKEVSDGQTNIFWADVSAEGDLSVGSFRDEDLKDET